jgi:uncharacterized protein (DUF2336 family)
MRPVSSLIPELESVVRHGSAERCAEAVRGVTTLFLHGADRFSEQHVGLFDDVLAILIKGIDTGARAELSRQLGPVENAPRGVVKRLAEDDDISVAGPVLTQSSRLSASDLVKIVNTMSAEHRVAISMRTEVEEEVADALVLRGDSIVLRKLAGNDGARISQAGFKTLVRRAERDVMLAEALTRRTDAPAHLVRELPRSAADAVRVAETSRPHATDVFIGVDAHIVDDAMTPDTARDFSQARTSMNAAADSGRPGEAELAGFAQERAYDEVVATLSRLTGVRVEVVDRLMSAERPDPVLILCKASGYSWETARHLLLARRESVAPARIDEASFNFDRLSTSTAQRVVRFWQVTPDGPDTAS